MPPALRLQSNTQSETDAAPVHARKPPQLVVSLASGGLRRIVVVWFVIIVGAQAALFTGCS